MVEFTHYKIDGIRGVTLFEDEKIVDIFPISQVCKKFFEMSDDHIKVRKNRKIKKIKKVKKAEKIKVKLKID